MHNIAEAQTMLTPNISDAQVTIRPWKYLFAFFIYHIGHNVLLRKMRPTDEIQTQLDEIQDRLETYIHDDDTRFARFKASIMYLANVLSSLTFLVSGIAYNVPGVEPYIPEQVDYHHGHLRHNVGNMRHGYPIGPLRSMYGGRDVQIMARSDCDAQHGTETAEPPV